MQPIIKLLSNNQRSPASLSVDGVENYERGILRITVPPFQLNSQTSRQKMRFIMYVSIDSSGSMSDIASRRGQDKQTKMDFVHMTMKNMIEYIASQEQENPHAEFYLAVVSFNSFASCVLPTCRVSNENKDNIIQVVLGIKPCGGTNFEKCFKEIANIMDHEREYIQDQSTFAEEYTMRMHVFLTDGANNEGEKNTQRLATFLKQLPSYASENSREPVTRKETEQIMVGYGCDHDSTVLQNLCAQFSKAKQWFIDDVEKTGCIFGEILWSAMNTAYSNVRLCSNVELYDFNKMSWEYDIMIDDVIYDSSRTFYLRVAPEVSSVVCWLRYFSIENPLNTSMDHTLEIEATLPTLQAPPIIDEDVEKELWRLDTIIIVDNALKFLQNIRRLPYNSYQNEKERLIQEVTAFQEKFLKYVKDKTLEEDPFIIQLADDLYVCINGLMATSIGERYVAARHVSQIQQRSVTVNDITPLQVDVISSMPSVRQSANQHDYDEEDDCIPAAPRRAISSGGYLGNNTPTLPPTTPLSQDPSTPCAPTTPTNNPSQPSTADENTTESQDQEKEDEKLVATFTPSSRGVGSKLRHLSREAILNYSSSRMRSRDTYFDDEDEFYSSGGGSADDTFSSHASPGCARIGRMLSAPTPKKTAVDRVSTCPY
jgi:hypothetical protein